MLLLGNWPAALWPKGSTASTEKEGAAYKEFEKSFEGAYKSLMV